MLSRINVFSSLVVIQTAESTKHKLSLHIICATVRHLGTKLPMHLCKRYVGYHWSDFRWLIVFVEEVSEEVRMELEHLLKMFAFLTVVSSRCTSST